MASWSLPFSAPDFIGRKQVDWSIFEDGTTIPIEFHQNFVNANGGSIIGRGLSHEISLLLEGITFKASLFNMNRNDFDTDTLQIRYDNNRELRKALKERFASSYDYISQARQINIVPGKKRYVKVPSAQAEFIDFYRTDTPFEYRIVLITLENVISNELKNYLKKVNEEVLEVALSSDMSDDEFKTWVEQVSGDSSIELKQTLSKLRHYRRSTIDKLKERYKGTCQICSKSTIEDYGVDTSEGHHIDYFSKTQNNKPSNIIILCPTHHRLLHKTKAHYDPLGKCFTCKNGKSLTIEVNYHL